MKYFFRRTASKNLQNQQDQQPFFQPEREEETAMPEESYATDTLGKAGVTKTPFYQPAGQATAIQTKSEDGSPNTPGKNIPQQLQDTAGQGEALPEDTQQEMEGAFGTDFSGVRVHRDEAAEEMNRDLGAQAFTYGSDIYFNDGKYNTRSNDGKRLLAHELTHVVQQQGTNGPANKLQRSPLSDELENIWLIGTKAEFFQRLRRLDQSDTDVNSFIESNLTGDDLWLARNIVNYGPESNWPIHLQVEREMKAWADSGGRAAVYELLRAANGAFSSDADLSATIDRYFAAGTDDHWLVSNLQAYGQESVWPIHLRVEREMKGWPDCGGRAAVFEILRAAGGAEALNVDLFISLQTIFTLTDDLWLADQLQHYGPEASWPIHLQLEREMKGWADTGGITEVFNIIRRQAGAQAANPDLTSTLSNLLTSGQISTADAWQAVGLQLMGNETNWPLVIKNFLEGIRGGQFTPPAGMPPSTVDGLTQTAVTTSHATAATGNFSNYQSIFNSVWDTSAYSSLSSEFDPNLTSKGPRTERSRAIFNHIYNTNTSIQTDYDANTGGIRELIDQYVGPESLNIIASPRLHTLTGLFRSTSTITATSLTDPAYIAFKTGIMPAAQGLDINDRQAISRSHEWRLLIDQVVSDAALRRDLSQFLATAWQSAPASSPPTTAPTGPTAPATPTAPAPTPLTLTSDQQAFVSGLTLQGPSSPVNSNNAEEQLDFRPQSSRNPAGLNVESRVEITPAGQVSEGQETQQPWPLTSAAGNLHSANVSVDGGTTGHTDFTASLTLVPNQGTIPIATPPTAIVRINDQRQTWFTSNIQHGLIFSDQNIEYLWSSGNHIEYYGGQQPLSVAPRLPSANRGLPIFMRGEVLMNGVSLQTLPLTEFGSTNQRSHLGGVTVLESTPPPTSPDNMELVVEFFTSTNVSGTPLHTIRQNFQIHPGAAFTLGQLLNYAQADHAQLNSTASGSILDDMTTMGGQAARISQAIQGGAILLEPTLIRPDSAAFLRTNPSLGNPNDHVAYLVGHTVVNNNHTLVGQPGADAWRWGRFPTSIFINLTPSLANPGSKRANSGIISTIIHESVHAVDTRPASGTFIERYKTEFRAYWMDGGYDHRPGSGSTPGPPRSTAFDPTMDNRGPKSEKARAIFNHLYGSSTYPWVRTNYDANTNHFREQVNAFIVPDGINMIVSLQLERIRAAIDSYTGGGFTAHQANVQNLYNATNALDQREIAGNRYWRALVEGQSNYSTGEQSTIKGLLGIPT